MGGSFDYRIYRADLGQRAIADRWAVDVETSRHEDGSSYSGAIGMLGPNIAAWHDLSFKSETEASDWLLSNQEKWEPGIAVSFTQEVRNPKNAAVFKKGKDEKLDLLHIEATTYKNILNHMASQFITAKAPFCTCPECRSRLNRIKLTAHVPSESEIENHFSVKDYKGARCPVCGHGLYREAQYKRLATAYKKVERAANAYKNFDMKNTVSYFPKYWMVGGWCSS